MLFLSALVAGNNLPVCAGTVISGRILRKRQGIAIAALGYASGFLIEGGFVRSGIYSIIYPIMGQVAISALLVAAVIFVIAHLFKVPQSLSIILMASLLGAGIGHAASIRWAFAALLLLLWALFALLSLLLPVLLMRLLRRRMLEGSIWYELRGVKMLLILLSFLAAFTLGANTIGIIYALIPSGATTALGIAIAVAAGSFLFSSGEIKTLGDEILPLRYLNAIVTQFTSVVFVEASTLIGMPLSNTQTFTAGLYGTALSYKSRLLLKKPTLLILATWTLTAFLSLAGGYIAVHIL